MKTLYTSKKPQLTTSPDHYWDMPNVFPFAYKKGILLYAAEKGKDSKIFMNGKVIGDTNYQFNNSTHRELLDKYGDVTKKHENKETWLRGRTDPTRTKVNFWGHHDEEELANVLQLLQGHRILKKKDSYEVGVVSRQGSNIYEIVPAETAPDIQLKPHKEIRKGIYAKLGLESKLRKILSILREELAKNR